MIPLLLALLLLLPGANKDWETAWRQGRYQEAYDLLRVALESPGAPKGPLLYNLGNCAYRLGRHAEAVLLYRRARLRLPRDRQVRFNLQLAERPLGISAPAQESFGRAVLRLVDAFTPWELLLLVIGLETFGLVGLVLFRRRRGLRAVMILVVLVAIGGAVRLVQRQWFPGRPAGVVVARAIQVRSEPHEQAKTLFRLRAGAPVHVGERAERWVRITHGQGDGWVPRESVGIVD